MVFPQRTALLRLVLLAALVASALLAANSLHPERAFCPLDGACQAAQESPLGTVYGIPTSLIGLAAFGAFFLLTHLPAEWAWTLLPKAGVLAFLGGLGLVAYQAIVLQSFCPLCVVVDVAGMAAGALTLTAPALPVRLSGRWLPFESLPSHLRWVTVAALAVAVPLFWPRTAPPAWEEITPLTEAELFDEELPAYDLEDGDGLALVDIVPAPVGESPRLAGGDPAPDAAGPARTPAHGVPQSPVVASPVAAPPVGGTAVPPGPRPTPAPRAITLEPAPVRPADAPRPAPEAPDPVAPARGASRPETVPVPVGADPAPEGPGASEEAPPQPETESEPAAEPAPRGPLVVLYLNAFCPHCRTTHRHLDRVLASTEGPVRVRRIYTWRNSDFPAWARACCYAATQGLEDRMFHELMKARSEQVPEVLAAGRRAGLDPNALRAALADPRPPRRLLRDRRLASRAGLRGLPTLDIGRRRLMGEQSERELRAAIEAARQASAAQRSP